jgi:hypothetical protein
MTAACPNVVPVGPVGTLNGFGGVIPARVGARARAGAGGDKATAEGKLIGGATGGTGRDMGGAMGGAGRGPVATDPGSIPAAR